MRPCMRYAKLTMAISRPRYPFDKRIIVLSRLRIHQVDASQIRPILLKSKQSRKASSVNNLNPKTFVMPLE